MGLKLLASLISDSVNLSIDRNKAENKWLHRSYSSNAIRDVGCLLMHVLNSMLQYLHSIGKFGSGWSIFAPRLLLILRNKALVHYSLHAFMNLSITQAIVEINQNWRGKSNDSDGATEMNNEGMIENLRVGNERAFEKIVRQARDNNDNNQQLSRKEYRDRLCGRGQF
jgi:hypothetical protein